MPEKMSSARRLAIAWYASCHTAAETARHFDVSKNTVCVICREYGIDRRTVNKRIGARVGFTPSGKNEKPPKRLPPGFCPICGEYSHEGGVCAVCDSDRRAKYRRIPDFALDGAQQLAGVILRGVVREYHDSYQNALRIAITRLELLDGFIPSDVREVGCLIYDAPEVQRLLELHKELQGRYYQNLSMDGMEPLLDGARQAARKAYPAHEIVRLATGGLDALLNK